VEFADVREYVAGDQQRHINWRASARRSRIQVNLFHSERSSDIVLLLDAFVDVAGSDVTSADLAIHAVLSAASSFLERRDRVGLLSFGSAVNWLLPGMGARQLYRIVDCVLQTQLYYSYSWPKVESVPRRVIPPGALVVALSPLVDSRMAAILLDLHSRGYDIAVVEIAVEELERDPVDHRERLAYRLWRLHREATRARYRRMGIPVSSWKPGTPLQLPFSELEKFKRTSRLVRA
jgi:uncharacterized protein (DUF58 family)